MLSLLSSVSVNVMSALKEIDSMKPAGKRSDDLDFSEDQGEEEEKSLLGKA